MRAIVVADGEIRGAAQAEPLAEWLAARKAGELMLVVAADGGAAKADLLGLPVDLVVGDADSLTEDAFRRLAAEGVEVNRYPADKNESDAELAVRAALERGATELLFVGALGGQRVEHALANVLLLTLPELRDVEVMLVDGPSTVRVMSTSPGTGGCLSITGEPRDYVSLLPLSEEVTGVTTSGLAYPLSDETLIQGYTRGLSNELVGTSAEVRTMGGRLAVVHTRRAALEEAK
ncbi:MAG TPA: thiamine diphosphokinase [Candidatus Limnocylindrales bacterium]|nr:thiamine diphosphokinase [Candidatus Limnocylindrales bacterium]